MRYQILLVEDDSLFRELLTDYIEEKSGGTYAITQATNGGQAEWLLYETPYDLVLLDVMMPGMDGFTLCQLIRRESDVPILFLTARHSEEDRLLGYQLGCDDYMVKPFSFAELLAKMGALLRRSKGMVGNPLLEAGNLTLDPARRQVMVDGDARSLSPKEYALLKLLLEQKGKAVPRETLLIRVWGYDFTGSDRVVDSHVKKLRKLLHGSTAQIKTVIKLGYRLEAPHET